MMKTVWALNLECRCKGAAQAALRRFGSPQRQAAIAFRCVALAREGQVLERNGKVNSILPILHSKKSEIKGSMA